MKNKKKQKKIKSLILLLFITIIMFGTSTYAWFTANQTVTISSLDVHVEASNGLQISTDAITWKTVITKDDITTNAYSGNINMYPHTLTAVSTDGTLYTDGTSYVSGGTKGLMKMFLGAVDSDETTGVYNIASSTITEAKMNPYTGTNLDNPTVGKFIAFDIFLKVDQDSDIYLTTASKVDHVASGTESTEDRGLKNSARVAFAFQGHEESTAAVNTVTATQNLVSTNTVYMWEPNAGNHTANAITIANEYGIKNDSNGNLGNGDVIRHYGLNAAFTSQDLKNTVKGAAGTHTTLMNNTNFKQTLTGFSSNVAMFRLTAGITKVRTYMWIEGQDIDCENNASGANIEFVVQLSLLA